jgi:Ion channel
VHIFFIILGAVLVYVVLMDAFETVVLPRRITRSFRITRTFYRVTWLPWSTLGRRIKADRRRENFLSYFGPLSLIMLLATWAFGLILGFALLQYGSGAGVRLGTERIDFPHLLYLSGSTFFTLGLGDVVPITAIARAFDVFEAGIGFGFLALVIGYLPVIYNGFSNREREISLLDSRAGSPPTTSELLTRCANCFEQPVLDDFLHDWERWSAELLESHISYPVLCYYRSQHNNQSWLGALTVILDTTALLIVGLEGLTARQARLTFAMTRHAIVDLAQVLNTPPDPNANRLTDDEFGKLRGILDRAGRHLNDNDDRLDELQRLRRMYEPYVVALARRLLITLPPWAGPVRPKDNWQSSAWDKLLKQGEVPSRALVRDGHF